MSRVPYYQQIVDDILRQITEGVLKPGDKLPSGRELMEKYGVSAEPVRRALDRLEAQGWIEGHQGKARYVKRRD